MHYEQVFKFMETGGQRVRRTVDRTAPFEQRLLDAKLILEETLEVLKELGFDLEVGQLVDKGISMVDVGTLAKELCDLRVVTTGRMITYGIPDYLQEVVDLNNLSKFSEGWSRREDGKILPGKKYVKLKTLESYF